MHEVHEVICICICTIRYGKAIVSGREVGSILDRGRGSPHTNLIAMEREREREMEESPSQA